jgi:hypothetical protein
MRLVRLDNRGIDQPDTNYIVQWRRGHKFRGRKLLAGLQL